MKVLLDQGVPLSTAALLRQDGFDAVHASEVGLSSAADGDILHWCRDNIAIAVTLDADFHSLIALSGEVKPSSIRLRRQGLKGPETAHLLREVLTAHAQALSAGVLITVQSNRLRLRRLPIVPRGR